MYIGTRIKSPYRVISSTPYNIPALVQKINATSNNLGRDAGEARQQCLGAARSLCFALETPVEAFLRNVWAEVRTISI